MSIKMNDNNYNMGDHVYVHVHGRPCKTMYMYMTTCTIVCYTQRRTCMDTCT